MTQQPFSEGEIVLNSGGEIELYQEQPIYETYPSFDELGGLDEPIQRLRDIASQFDDPDFWQEYGVKRPHGILLVGPGGVGKTHLAYAFARECKARVEKIKVSEIMDKWVGGSNSNLARIFNDACVEDGRTVILFNEFDAFFAHNAGGNSGVNASIVGELKDIMESLGETHPDVIVVGSTNSTSGFDPALLRPARFREIIQIGHPDQQTRSQIFGAQMGQHARFYDLRDPREGGIDLTVLAETTDGMTGDDISAVLMAERMRLAMLKKRAGENGIITQSDLLRAVDRHRRQRLSGND